MTIPHFMLLVSFYQLHSQLKMIHQGDSSMLVHFKTFQLAVSFHQQMKNLKTPIYLKDQLLRASSSVALNLAEGSAKLSRKDQARFYQIALGSLKESEAILILINFESTETSKLYFHLYCSINKLIRNII